jgi:hypothetical protein
VLATGTADALLSLNPFFFRANAEPINVKLGANS